MPLFFGVESLFPLDDLDVLCVESSATVTI